MTADAYNEMITIPRQTLIDLLVQLKVLRSGYPIEAARRYAAMEVEMYLRDQAPNQGEDMMGNLVQRLRANELPGDRQHQREARIVLASLLSEAADQIETLERELKQMTKP